MLTETYSLPRHWAGYLIYGERDGYDEGETTLIDQWARRTFYDAHFWDCVNVADDNHFAWYHDARRVLPVGCECLTYTFHTDRS